MSPATRMKRALMEERSRKEEGRNRKEERNRKEGTKPMRMMMRMMVNLEQGVNEGALMVTGGRGTHSRA